MSIFRKQKKEVGLRPKLQKKGENQEEKEKGDGQPGKKPKPDKKTKKGPKPKDDTYTLKKNTAVKVFRIIFWLMLLGIFARGVYQIVKPQEATELRRIIADFKAEQQNIGNAPDEVMDFAQDFAKEYLTYEKGGEEDFKNRISGYVSKRVSGIPSLYTYRSNAKAVYVHAYRRDEQNGLYNVYVDAEIQYDKGEEGMVYDDCTLKIPVVATEAGYCIAALPVYVQDKRQDKDYKMPQSQLGTEIDTSTIAPAVTNFLEAYYAQEQSMINYLLTADADKNKFIAMDSRYTFKRIDSIKAYQKADAVDIICLLSVKIIDTTNQEEIYQEYILTLIQNNDKYYIKDMETGVY
ncbi:conjugal transfer protein [Lachnoclostridium pacaense]|uniref:conjugal transfer protein n=1 Tax=Enterocloster hominis (ex Hitch et al. 2024) TaxID=1917870 RepID=UPI001D11B57D|nr:conjugal transfer protein [Lachnoclostridium pacaense]MCC2821004.1 conjugal transfer protein [Lachnoclostridium pacaense]